MGLSSFIPQLRAKFLDHRQQGGSRESDRVMKTEERLLERVAHGFHLLFPEILRGRGGVVSK
jgi:hypothetical protein